MTDFYEFAIVGHQNRAQRARALADRTGATCMSLDDGFLGAGRNHLRVWRWLADSSAEWCVVLEDDAVLSPWFMSGDLSDVLKTCPGPVASLYLGRSRPPHWQNAIASVVATDNSWLVADELFHHVAVAIKTSLVPIVIDGIDKLLTTMPIDEAIGKRLREIGVSVAYSNPSVVNHDDSLPTTIEKHLSQHTSDDGTRDDCGPRRAWNMMGCASRSWDTSSIRIPTPIA